ncbi:hypothetical protein BDZ45DRAFT_674515 [Acephala macrosclerotiorum]|nr:hypothetical protein BDZ45DRAFT_674515 [Acephala macrosclerotiorum]
MASFGWSAGDIISTITLVNRIRQSISGAHDAREHFQELDSELQALSRALDEISDLTRMPGQVPEIEALKFASCLCCDTLQRFYDKIRPFEESLGKASAKSRIKASPRMVRWELLIRKDVPEVRSYLVAHVGSLQLRLSTALLKGASRSQLYAQDNQVKQAASFASVQQLITQQSTVLSKITQISSDETIPKLDSLLTIAMGVWKAQNEILSMLAKASEQTPPPDLSHTWAQDPVKFEDALGRRFIVPSEYDWDKLEAIIQAQFKQGPGQKKVLSGEYELFDRRTGTPITGPTFSGLIPGACITMTFIIGKYSRGKTIEDTCARIGCGSSRVIKVKSFASMCIDCQSFFRISHKPLPRPMKPIAGDVGASTTSMQVFTQAAMRDRLSYKNISLYLVELPGTPKKFRDKVYRDSIVEDRRRYREQRTEALERLLGELRRDEIQNAISIAVPNPINSSSKSGAPKPGGHRALSAVQPELPPQVQVPFYSTSDPPAYQVDWQGIDIDEPTSAEALTDLEFLERRWEEAQQSLNQVEIPQMTLEPLKKFDSVELQRYYKNDELRYDAIIEEEEDDNEGVNCAEGGKEHYTPPALAEWPLLKILRLLVDNDFSPEWRKAFIAENIHGVRFLDLLQEQHSSGWCLMCRSTSPKLLWQNIMDEVKNDRELNWSEINEGARLIWLVKGMNG